jgi:DNA-binding transcriptional MerR regulator
MGYTVKEIADLAGVSPRTIRYYDEIGLLTPVKLGENGYRYYDRANLERLQQILFYRELDVPLKEIRAIIGAEQFHAREALLEHRNALMARADRLNRLIHTLDRTLAAYEGGPPMSVEDYFEGFDEKKYEAEARARWGDTRAYAESTQRWGSYSPEEKEAIKTEGGRITLKMVGPDGDTRPDDPDVQDGVAEYLAYLNTYFYTCGPEFLRNLSDMWVADERFAVNYERIRPGGAKFVRAAVHHFCDTHEG